MFGVSAGGKSCLGAWTLTLLRFHHPLERRWSALSISVLLPYCSQRATLFAFEIFCPFSWINYNLFCSICLRAHAQTLCSNSKQVLILSKPAFYLAKILIYLFLTSRCNEFFFSGESQIIVHLKLNAFKYIKALSFSAKLVTEFDLYFLCESFTFYEELRVNN